MFLVRVLVLWFGLFLVPLSPSFDAAFLMIAAEVFLYAVLWIPELWKRRG